MVDASNVAVLFLIYNRPDNTRLVFRAISEARPKRLYIAADGPRLTVAGDEERCRQARAVVDAVDWDCEVKTLFREDNLESGIAVSSAINWFFFHEEEGIILEDDCLPSRSFFSFCAELLERYRDDDRVMMISGNNYLSQDVTGGASYYFSRIPHTWGWATWRRAWKLFDFKMRELPAFIAGKQLDRVFAQKEIRSYWLNCFIPTYEGRIQCWDYRWRFAIFLHKGVSICPCVNLVSNIGFGMDASHTFDEESPLANRLVHELFSFRHADCMEVDVGADLYTYDIFFDVWFRRDRWAIFSWRKRMRKRWKTFKMERRFLMAHDLWHRNKRLTKVWEMFS